MSVDGDNDNDGGGGGGGGDAALAAVQPDILRFFTARLTGAACAGSGEHEGEGGAGSALMISPAQRVLCGESLAWVAKGVIQRGEDRKAARTLIQLFVGLLTAPPTAASNTGAFPNNR